MSFQSCRPLQRQVLLYNYPHRESLLYRKTNPESPSRIRNGLTLSELYQQEPEERQAAQGLIRIHQETGIPLVCTNDAHYLRREDARIQDVLMCIQTGKTV